MALLLRNPRRPLAFFLASPASPIPLAVDFDLDTGIIGTCRNPKTYSLSPLMLSKRFISICLFLNFKTMPQAVQFKVNCALVCCSTWLYRRLLALVCSRTEAVKLFRLTGAITCKSLENRRYNILSSCLACCTVRPQASIEKPVRFRDAAAMLTANQPINQLDLKRPSLVVLVSSCRPSLMLPRSPTSVLALKPPVPCLNQPYQMTFNYQHALEMPLLCSTTDAATYLSAQHSSVSLTMLDLPPTAYGTQDAATYLKRPTGTHPRLRHLLQLKFTGLRCKLGFNPNSFLLYQFNGRVQLESNIVPFVLSSSFKVYTDSIRRINEATAQRTGASFLTCKASPLDSTCTIASQRLSRNSDVQRRSRTRCGPRANSLRIASLERADCEASTVRFESARPRSAHPDISYKLRVPRRADSKTSFARLGGPPAPPSPRRLRQIGARALRARSSARVPESTRVTCLFTNSQPPRSDARLSLPMQGGPRALAGASGRARKFEGEGSLAPLAAGCTDAAGSPAPRANAVPGNRTSSGDTDGGLRGQGASRSQVVIAGRPDSRFGAGTHASAGAARAFTSTAPRPWARVWGVRECAGCARVRGLRPLAATRTRRVDQASPHCTGSGLVDGGGCGTSRTRGRPAFGEEQVARGGADRCSADLTAALVNGGRCAAERRDTRGRRGGLHPART
ncbi:hypothetical protein B0H15DRAFT_803652 [Mycena belliarum]|uniref:Uncharacterized protein n=1 Tax=Mycena belliarum TaxID=1033014 RepID=A0AAD6TZZ7_9AGAR|nr:hypothetical protein B0H15DRAFT_803652 [Mycena belliae]